MVETVGAGARSQSASDLLGWSVVRQAPPISMHSVLCLQGTKSSALRRIALTAGTTECWGGVPGGGDPGHWPAIQSCCIFLLP